MRKVTAYITNDMHIFLSFKEAAKHEHGLKDKLEEVKLEEQ